MRYFLVSVKFRLINDVNDVKTNPVRVHEHANMVKMDRKLHLVSLCPLE